MNNIQRIPHSRRFLVCERLSIRTLVWRPLSSWCAANREYLKPVALSFGIIFCRLAPNLCQFMAITHPLKSTLDLEATNLLRRRFLGSHAAWHPIKRLLKRLAGYKQRKNNWITIFPFSLSQSSNAADLWTTRTGWTVGGARRTPNLKCLWAAVKTAKMVPYAT